MTNTDSLQMRCTQCQFEWDEMITVPMRFKSFIKRLDILCPKCGAKPKDIIIATKTKREGRDLKA